MPSFVATPGKAQRVPITATVDDDSESKDADVDESEITDSDAENKLNPDEYEDDTTEFGQSEAAANDSQNEVCLAACLIYLLPPPKKEVMFLVRSVCLSVCLSDYSQTCERILTKFFVGVGHGSRTK